MDKGYKISNVPNLSSYDISILNRDKNKYLEKKDRFNNYMRELARSGQEIINGDEISQILFPEGEYNIFISHSHQDLDKALYIKHLSEDAGYSAFVDSVIWGNVDDLLKKLLKSYSTTSDTIFRLTSNAYLMLATALISVINKSNIFIFLATQNSMPFRIHSNHVTLSPWINLELRASKMLFLQPLHEGREAMTASIRFSYAVDTNHLNDITFDDFKYKILHHSL